MIRFVTLDCPSVCGLKAELVHSVVPQRRKSSCHIVLVKMGSLSLTIEASMPWSRTMFSKKAAATVVAVYGWCKAMKWPYLDSQSTTVKITVLPPTFGSPSTKSIVMSCHTTDGTSSGYSSPAECKCSVLWSWQVVQPLMNSLTRRASCGMKKEPRSRMRVLWMPS
jgi:hypothetical protein